MIKQPLDRINKFLRLKEKEGKEVIYMSKPDVEGFDSIIVPYLSINAKKEVFIELIDIRNVVPVGVSVFLMNAKGLNKNKGLSPYILKRSWEFGSVYGLGREGTYTPRINGKDSNTLRLMDFWPTPNSKNYRTFHPSTLEGTYITHLHSLINAVVMRDRLVTTLVDETRLDSTTEKYKNRLRGLIKEMNTDIIKLIDTYPVLEYRHY